jgi:hypothetical protein
VRTGSPIATQWLGEKGDINEYEAESVGGGVAAGDRDPASGTAGAASFDIGVHLGREDRTGAVVALWSVEHVIRHSQKQNLKGPRGESRAGLFLAYSAS